VGQISQSETAVGNCRFVFFWGNLKNFRERERERGREGNLTVFKDFKSSIPRNVFQLPNQF
jgi:hypothetical protein